MKRILIRIGVPVLAAIACMAGAAWYFGVGGRDRDALPPAEAAPGRDPSAVAVVSQEVRFRPVQSAVEAVGTLYGYEEVDVSAKEEGRILKIRHDVGDRVKPDDVLLEIDPTDYDSAVRQAQRALDVELARLGVSEPPGDDFDVRRVPAVVQAAARKDNARTRYARALAAREGSTREEIDDRAADVQVAEAEYTNQILTARVGLAGLRVKQEALALARQQLKDAAVRAPVPTLMAPGDENSPTYVITRRAAAEGAYVKSGADVFRLVIDRTLKLRAAVPEREAADVRVGQKAEVYAATGPSPYDGAVARINPAVDSATRTIEVEIAVPNPQGALRPGGFAKARILTRVEPDAPTVPRDAIVSLGGVAKVFLTDGKRVRETPVTAGTQGEDWVAIVQPPLPRGARVVTGAPATLADGDAVFERGR